MEIKKNVIFKKKCPECDNYIKFRIRDDGSLNSVCPYCKSIITIKQISDIEKIINISHFM